MSTDKLDDALDKFEDGSPLSHEDKHLLAKAFTLHFFEKKTQANELVTVREIKEMIKATIPGGVEGDDYLTELEQEGHIKVVSQ